MIIGGSASRELAAETANLGEFTLGKSETERFPDGECYVRLGTGVKGKHIAIIQTAFPDGNIIELFLLQDAARRAGAAQITVVVPYLGYARQDKLFHEGEAVSAIALSNLLSLYADRFITMDIHETSTLKSVHVPAGNISAMPEIGRFVERFEPDLVVSPDRGAVELARSVSGVLDRPWDYLEKTRLDGRTVKIAPKNMDVNGKTVVIVDDIIATGGTIINATGQLRAQGARKVYAACTHGLFTSNALPKLGKACDGVFSTNTIPGEASRISAAQPIADALAVLRT